MILPMNAGGAVRGGVLGCLSTKSSPSASTVKMPTVIQLPTQEAQVPFRLIQCSAAAQEMTAGAVMDRRPAITPIPRASSRTWKCIMCDMTTPPQGSTNERGSSGTLTQRRPYHWGIHDQNRKNRTFDARIALAPMAA